MSIFGPGMSIFGRFAGCDCALQLTSTVAIVVIPGRGNGEGWRQHVELPPGAVRPRLSGENLDPAVLTPLLRELADAVPRRVSAVTLVLPDACAKVHVVPIESEQVPGRRATEEIIRWAFRDTLPFPVEEALIDTQLYDDGVQRRLLVAAAHRDVLQQYEQAAAVFGPVVRTMPATLACGWSVGERAAAPQLLVYADDDSVGCMVSSSSSPVFIRARPRRGEGSIAAAVVETLEYAANRLDIGTGQATISGLAAGNEELETTLTSRGWVLRTGNDEFDAGGARFGALDGALRAAEAGI